MYYILIYLSLLFYSGQHTEALSNPEAYNMFLLLFYKCISVLFLLPHPPLSVSESRNSSSVHLTLNLPNQITLSAEATLLLDVDPSRLQQCCDSMRSRQSSLHDLSWHSSWRKNFLLFWKSEVTMCLLFWILFFVFLATLENNVSCHVSDVQIRSVTMLKTAVNFRSAMCIIMNVRSVWKS